MSRTFSWLGCFALAAVLGCRGSRAADPRALAISPRFEDAVAGKPSAVLVVRPQALLHDRTYGLLLQRATGLARLRGVIPSAGATALTALERADEVDVVMWGGSDEALVAFRGIPAELDAARLVDAEGRALWRPAAHAASGVDELLSVSATASLFVLPGRTWVVAVGPAIDRARRAYALPPARRAAAPFDTEPEALASLVLSGEAVLKAAPGLEHGELAALSHDLDHVSVWLAPGRRGVLEARLVFATEASARAAAEVADSVVQSFRRSILARAEGTDVPSVDGASLDRAGPLRLGFLAAAGVTRTAATVAIRAPIPARWLEDIARADLSVGDAGEPGGQEQIPRPPLTQGAR